MKCPSFLFSGYVVTFFYIQKTKGDKDVMIKKNNSKRDFNSLNEI